jgi:hypothetical protein
MNFQKCIDGVYNFGTTNNPQPGTTNNPSRGTTNNPSVGTTNNPPAGSLGPYDNGGGSGASFNDGTNQLMNPLSSSSLMEFLLAVLDIFIIFAIPIIILMIIYAGFMYVTARGSEEKITTATRSLTYAVLGGLLILGARLILQVIEGTLSQILN